MVQWDCRWKRQNPQMTSSRSVSVARSCEIYGTKVDVLSQPFVTLVFRMSAPKGFDPAKTFTNRHHLHKDTPSCSKPTPFSLGHHSILGPRSREIQVPSMSFPRRLGPSYLEGKPHDVHDEVAQVRFLLKLGGTLRYQEPWEQMDSGPQWQEWGSLTKVMIL